MNQEPKYIVKQLHASRTLIGEMKQYGIPSLVIFDLASGGNDDGGYIPDMSMSFYGLTYIKTLRDFCNELIAEHEALNKPTQEPTHPNTKCTT